MKWVITAKMKAEILTRFIAEGTSYQDVIDVVNERAKNDELEDFEIVEAQPFVEGFEDDKEERIVN